MRHSSLACFSIGLAVLFTAAGCGSSRPEPDGGGGDIDASARADGGGTRDDASAPADGGGCPSGVVPVEGMACTSEGLDCGPPCTDICSFCVVFRCEGGTWTRLEAAPAPCFDCGDDLRCVGYSEYCHVTTSDVGGVPGTYECVDLPSGCRSMPTCECVTMTVGADDCSEDASRGAVTVTQFGG